MIDELNKWNNDNKYLLDFTDTAQVTSGSVSNNSDCRPCDLKREFNRQINASSAVIFIIGFRHLVLPETNNKNMNKEHYSTRIGDGPAGIKKTSICEQFLVQYPISDMETVLANVYSDH